MSEYIKVFYLNGDGRGFARKVEVPVGTTTGAFIRGQLKQDYEQQEELQNPSKWDIRVNGEIPVAEDVLLDGARVTIAPDKVGGA